MKVWELINHLNQFDGNKDAHDALALIQPELDTEVKTGLIDPRSEETTPAL